MLVCRFAGFIISKTATVHVDVEVEVGAQQWLLYCLMVLRRENGIWQMAVEEQTKKHIHNFFLAPVFCSVARVCFNLF